jgi:Sec63 Brl domain
MGLYETSSGKNFELFDDSEKAIASFPVINVDVSYCVEGETDIAVGDFLTIKLSLTHVNLKDENTQLGFVHSNKFPYLKRSSWYLIFTDGEENELFAMEKLVINERVHVKEIKERMSRPGTIELTLLLRNDSYRGFDKRIDIKIPVLKEAKRAEVVYDEEDIQAMKAPTLMQQVMEVNPEDSDDDEESDEDESPKKEVTAGETKKDK